MGDYKTHIDKEKKAGRTHGDGATEDTEKAKARDCNGIDSSAGSDTAIGKLTAGGLLRENPNAWRDKRRDETGLCASDLTVWGRLSRGRTTTDFCANGAGIIMEHTMKCSICARLENSEKRRPAVCGRLRG